jgi:hypothetical protein
LERGEALEGDGGRGPGDGDGSRCVDYDVRSGIEVEIHGKSFGDGSHRDGGGRGWERKYCGELGVRGGREGQKWRRKARIEMNLVI